MDLHGWYENGHLYMMRKGCWWWYTCIFTYIQYLYTFLKIKVIFEIEYHLEGYLQFYLKWKEKEKKKGRYIKISKKSKEKRKKEIEVFPFLKKFLPNKKSQKEKS